MQLSNYIGEATAYDKKLMLRDYCEIGSEVHIDIFDDRMEISSPGGMPSGDLVQQLDWMNVTSIRRNPVIADLS